MALRLSSCALVGALLLGVYMGGFACGSSTETKYVDVPGDDDDTGDASVDVQQPSGDSGLGILTLRPNLSYSGFDGTHTFTVPVAAYDSGDDLTLTADDPSAVDIVPKLLAQPVKSDGTTDNGKYFFVTVKKAGTVKLTATSKGKTATSTLTVTSYTPDRWATGQTRYLNGGMGDPPCTDCHVNGMAVDHSPAALATASDEKVETIITTGISTSGFPIMINGQPGHKWKVSDDERNGLVTYLRALDPRGFK